MAADSYDFAERSHVATRGRRRNHQNANQPMTANGSTPPMSLEDGVATAQMTGTLAAQMRRAQDGRNPAHKPAAARTSAPPTSNPTSAYVWSGGSGEPQQFENWVAATPTSAQRTASVPSTPATRCTLLGRPPASITITMSRGLGTSAQCDYPPFIAVALMLTGRPAAGAALTDSHLLERPRDGSAVATFPVVLETGGRSSSDPSMLTKQPTPEDASHPHGVDTRYVLRGTRIYSRVIAYAVTNTTRMPSTRAAQLCVVSPSTSLLSGSK